MERLKKRKKVIIETVDESLDISDGMNLTITADADGAQVFMEAHGRHIPKGSDVLTIATPIEKVTLGDQKVLGEGKLNLDFRTTFAPGPEIGRLRCIIAGEIVTIEGMDFTPEDWRDLADKLTARNAALGFIIPDGKSKTEGHPYGRP